MLLNARWKFVEAVRTTFLIPMVLPPIVVAIIWIQPQATLWILSTGYILSGPAEALLRRTLAIRQRGPAQEKPLSRP